MGRDFWPYGIESNRLTIDAFLRYAFEQSLTAKQLAVEELFTRETQQPVHI